MSAITATASSPLPIAAEAIKKALVNVAKDANVIANAPSADSFQTIQALVDAKQQVLYTKAGVAIIAAADQMLKSLLDTHA